ncbi:matrilysin-like [Schistocerca americana]|uniref:matrilysin-like n=1 Tax=Schistocerca americana TaxID=7009 RepID=UPI001F4F701A|nr:matrilysin-like [Schistocerca americana]
MKTIVLTLIFCGVVSANEEVIKYLHDFGYLEPDSTNIPELSDIRNALILLQEKFNLKPTGEISDETFELIRRPRCGVEDHAQSFTSHIDKWNKKNIKWYYAGSSKRTKELTEIAFNTWKEHTDLTFEEDQSNSDIIISNKRRLHRKETSGQHFCSKPFDGTGGVLGHAFYPDINNNAVEIHMDQDEDWYFEIDTNTPKEKINFCAVLVHEIGHTLGLAHSAENTSIMYPMYNSSNIELSKDDILGIQSLYGKQDEDESKDDNNEVEEDSNPPELCKLNKKIKNFLIVDKVLYIYYEKWVWVMDLDNLNVHPKLQLISDWLTFLPKGFKNITADYQRPPGDVVLFIDNKLYVMEIPSFKLKYGYPQSLTNLSLRKNVALHSAINSYSGKSFIFFDDVYYIEVD